MYFLSETVRKLFSDVCESCALKDLSQNPDPNVKRARTNTNDHSLPTCTTSSGCLCLFRVPNPEVVQEQGTLASG